MNLDSLTDAQRACVQHLSGPLFIAAGAGSGKTFTLQQRIAYALLPESGPFCSSIDEVLAITFMEKAAAEVKTRVRRALLAEGMASEALKVDSAWISTIHSMCSRILRENAFDAGVDPEFEVLSDFDASSLRAEAIERVLARERDNEHFAALFAEYGAGGSKQSRRGGGTSVFDMLQDVLDKASSFSEGLEVIDIGPEPPLPSQIAREVLIAYEDALALVEGVMGAKPSKTQQTTQTNCTSAVEELQGFLLRGEQDYSSLGEVLKGLVAPTKSSFGSKAGEAGLETCQKVRTALACARDDVNAALARPHASALLELAHLTDEEYQGMLDAKAYLDNDGLLHRCYELLRSRPEIAETYQRRFKLVMVDEFQDTNQLQIDLISLVAGTENLCTVGDAQQSIYRFNGADVGVFKHQRSRAESDASGQALVQRLDDNFRSHGDVLAFVRRVCGQEQVFGEAFLDLHASREERGAFLGGCPRVEVQLSSYEGSLDGSGVLRAQAEGIADRFAALRDAGHGAGEMVLLLSSMSKVEVYAQALRERGFSCVLSGGSGFFDAPEVQTVGDVLEILVDPFDTEALFSVLSGDLVQLSADDFLQLATAVDPQSGKLRSRSLDRGFWEEGAAARAARGGAATVAAGGAVASSEAPSSPSSPALVFAFELFERARGRMSSMKPSQVLLALFSESGWLARLEDEGVEGVSRAANVLKALRVVEELEQKPGAGYASVAQGFRAHAVSVRDGPGSLSVSDEDAVRIMTIHKSKGLEFPIVAVAEFEPRDIRRGSFACDAVDGQVRMAISAGKSKLELAKGPLSSEIETDGLDFDRAGDPAQFAELLHRRSNEEELAEARRKFYVACTRASEYLLVSGRVKETKDPLDGYKSAPVLNDVRSALVGEEDFPDGEARLDYGGSEPLRFARVRAGEGRQGGETLPEGTEAADEGGRVEEAAPVGDLAGGTFMKVPILSSTVCPPCDSLPSNAREGMFSYTSLSSREGAAAQERTEDGEADEGKAALPTGAAAAEGEELAAIPSATDLGQAFHRTAELAVLLRRSTGKLSLPPAERVDSIARRHGAAEGPARARLDAALERWFASDVCARADAHDDLGAEVPFLARIDCEGEPLLLEGEIDLLATDHDGARAFVVDYKTGGSRKESPEQLLEKHSLQANCYAYALLLQGYEEVELDFVRVEQPDPADAQKPQVVSYRFVAADLPDVRALIESAHAQAGR